MWPDFVFDKLKCMFSCYEKFSLHYVKEKIIVKIDIATENWKKNSLNFDFFCQGGPYLQVLQQMEQKTGG